MNRPDGFIWPVNLLERVLCGRQGSAIGIYGMDKWDMKLETPKDSKVPKSA
jgi:hypothetical protein